MYTIKPIRNTVHNIIFGRNISVNKYYGCGKWYNNNSRPEKKRDYEIFDLHTKRIIGSIPRKVTLRTEKTDLL